MWAGPRSIVLHAAKEFLPSPTSIYKGEIKPGAICSLAPSQVLKCHFWGAALPGWGTASRETRALSPISLGRWWAFSRPHLPPRGPGCSNPTPECFPHPRSQSLRAESGLELPLAQWRLGLSCWVSISALGSAGAFQQREPPEMPFLLSVAWCPHLCLL